MLMVTPEDLKPGTVPLPVQTEICPSHSNRAALPWRAAPGFVRAFYAQSGRLYPWQWASCLPWFRQTQWELQRHAEAIASNIPDAQIQET